MARPAAAGLANRHYFLPLRDTATSAATATPTRAMVPGSGTEGMPPAANAAPLNAERAATPATNFRTERMTTPLDGGTVVSAEFANNNNARAFARTHVFSNSHAKRDIHLQINHLRSPRLNHGLKL